jgi:hypothetical protein
VGARQVVNVELPLVRGVQSHRARITNPGQSSQLVAELCAEEAPYQTSFSMPNSMRSSSSRSRQYRACQRAGGVASILSNLSLPTKMKAEGETALEVK